MIVVAGPSAERAAAFAAAHGCGEWTTDWEAAVQDPRVDAVVVGTPNSLHAAQVITSLRAGKDVLVDKPMATSQEDADAMIDEARAADRLLLVGHMFRYRDEVRALRRRVESGEFGAVSRTTAYGCHLDFGPSGWFLDVSRSGGGALIDLGIHAIDTTRFVLGDPAPMDVSATIVFSPDYPGIDTGGTLDITWEGGIQSRVEFGWWQPSIDGLIGDVEVWGTEGRGRIWPAQPPPGYEHGGIEMYEAQMRDFVARCGRGFDPAACEPGRTALSIALAGYRAASLEPPVHA